MTRITTCKSILCAVFGLICSTQIFSQQQALKNFEGYYQLSKDTSAYLQISSQENNLILHQLWDGKKISFERKSDLEFFNQEYSFPLKFSNGQDGKITQVVAFNRDLWN